MTAGLLTLRRLKAGSTYETLATRSARLSEGVANAATEAGIKTVTNRVGSMWTTFFNEGAVTDWTTASKSDRDALRQIFSRDAGSGRLPGAVAI